VAWKMNREKCLRCGACVSVCPQLALNLRDECIIHDSARCTLCAICAKVCPVRSIKVEK
jgi:pyruvate formate lyase activating enzyme